MLCACDLVSKIVDHWIKRNNKTQHVAVQDTVTQWPLDVLWLLLPQRCGADARLSFS